MRMHDNVTFFGFGVSASINPLCRAIAVVGYDGKFALPKDTIWMRGYDGQSIANIPSKKMVVLRMGITPSRLNFKRRGLVQRLVAVLE